MEVADSPLPSANASIPPWLTLTTQLLYGFSAVTRSKPLTFFSIAYGLYWLVELVRRPPSGDYLSVYLVGTQLFSNVARIINSTLLQKAEDFERRTDSKKNEDGAKTPRGFKQWILDSLEVGFVATRGVGWNWQLKTIRPSKTPAGYPRYKFVFETLCGAVIRLLAVDAASMYIRSTPLGTIPLTKTFADEPLHIAMGRAWLVYLQGRWSIDAYYRVAAAIFTGLGLFGPEAWPPMFGPWREAYTVRRFWAYTWHSMMRPVAQFPTNWAANVLRLPARSKLTFYFKVCGAFFWAYAVHGYGTHIAGASHMVDFWRYAPQVLAIFAEEQVIDLAQRVGIKDGVLVRIIGYVWVVVFQGFTLMWWQSEAARLGAYTRPPYGFSPVEWALKKFV